MTTHRRRLRALLVLMALVSLLATACGSDDPTGGVTDIDEVKASAVEGAETEATDGAGDADGPADTVEASDDSRGVEVGGDLETKPEITLPDTEPPSELVVVDLIEGEGEEAPPGATVAVDYVGVSWTNDGEQFDSSWDRGEPATFPLDGVIPGWTQGIPGMKVGGRRLLIIPPELGYGDSPPPTSSIPVDDTLVFVVDLTAIQ